MVNDKQTKEQNVASEPRPKYLCTEQKEKQATHSYNLRSKARQQQQQQQQQQVDGNNNSEETNRNLGGAVKRAYDYVDTVETEDDSVPVAVGGRKSPAKKAKFIVTYKEMNDFFNLLKDQSISEFLRRDACCLISDKYALAMVFTYFKRAKYTCDEFTVFNFYLALYLASDIEEDVDEYKYEIFPWALGPKWRSKFSSFLKKRDALLRRIGYRAIVSRKCCEEVMSFVADHYVWKRERSEDHGGATRAYLITRGRRLLSSRSHLEEEELNLPRGPFELPRPCPLCFLNRPDTNLNRCKYIVPGTPSASFRPKLLLASAFSTFASDAEECDSSSNTSGYVSNESHASSVSNLSSYSTESSFYSNDQTIRKNDHQADLHLSCTQKQVKPPSILYPPPPKVTNTLKKDLISDNQIESDIFLSLCQPAHESTNLKENKSNLNGLGGAFGTAGQRYASAGCASDYCLDDEASSGLEQDEVFDCSSETMGAHVKAKASSKKKLNYSLNSAFTFQSGTIQRYLPISQTALGKYTIVNFD